MSPRALRPPLAVTVEYDGPFRVLVHCSEAPPSLNAVTSMLPIQRAREAKRWRSAVAAAVDRAGLSLPAPVRLTLSYVWPDRRRRDRLNFPAKWAIDGLVEGGLIPDDDSETIDEVIIIRFRYAKGERRLSIALESLR